MAAFSSLLEKSPPSFEEVDRRGVPEASTSRDGLAEDGSPAVAARRLAGNFSDDEERRGDSSRCFSAMADTAASTFCSNSSSVMVRVVRSMFSMNWIAPIYIWLEVVNTRLTLATYQGREIIPSLPSQLLLIAETENVLYIRDKVLGIRLESDVDQERHERIGR